MSLGGRPLFSILIPSYNRPEYITECIDSVLANEGEDYELIISDDASPAAAAIEEAVRPYLAHSNIQFHRQRTNLGEPGNRNFLVSQAIGEYNIILCDDDKLVPHALRTIRQYIKDDPGQDLYGFGYTVIDEKGKPCYSRYAPKGFAVNLEHPELVHRMFEAAWLPFLVCHPATFCCKRGVEKEIPYRQDVSTADDFMFLLDCLNKGKRMYVLPECLMWYRWFQSHETTKQINQSSAIMKVLQAYTKVYYVLQQRADLHPSIAGFTSSSDYRKRFLYEPIMRRIQITDDTMDLLKLQPVHRQELAEYAANPWRYLVFVKSALAVANELAQLFGVRGIVYSIQVGVAYLRFKVLRAWAASPG
jgi:glycosyltransferase involved in cell wall biosynthesis